MPIMSRPLKIAGRPYTAGTLTLSPHNSLALALTCIWIGVGRRMPLLVITSCAHDRNTLQADDDDDDDTTHQHCARELHGPE